MFQNKRNIFKEDPFFQETHQTKVSEETWKRGRYLSKEVKRLRARLRKLLASVKRSYVGAESIFANGANVLWNWFAKATLSGKRGERS